MEALIRLRCNCVIDRFKTESELKLCYNRRQSTSVSWYQAPSGAQDHILVNVRQLRVSWCGALWREAGSVVYNCCWLSAAQSFPRRSWSYLTVSDSTLPQTWRAKFLYLYPLGTVWPSYTPRHLVPFSSPPATRRVTVEVFEHNSTPAQLGFSHRIVYKD
jgi:hypothetical protein